MVPKGYRKVVDDDKVRFVWVNDPQIDDVPNNYRYMDIEGRVIQLYGESDTSFHSWGVYDLATGKVESDQRSNAPPTFRIWSAMVDMLKSRGYGRFGDLLHDQPGMSTDNYATDDSPTWHISISIMDSDVAWIGGWVWGKGRGIPRADAPIQIAEVHRDSVSPRKRPFEHFRKDVIGMHRGYKVRTAKKNE
jgi:hypothetical protein